MLVTFLTDFGLEDDFVGTCHGVMKRIAPEVEIIDITHGIQPHGVLQGALVLANTLPYLPEGRAPGGRRSRASAAGGVALALRSGDGRLFVGPDNGLLVPAAEKLGGIEAAHEMTNEAYVLEPVSATFHGRDVFSPAAAHLASGVALEELGPSDRAGVARPARGAEARRDASADPRLCLYVDRFGNMELNLTREDLERARHRAGHPGRARNRGRSATTRSPRGRSPMRATARSSSTRTRTRTSRSRSAAAARPETFFSAQPGVEVRIRLAD